MTKKVQQKRRLIARVSYNQWLAVKGWARVDGCGTSVVIRELIDREERRRERASGGAA